MISINTQPLGILNQQRKSASSLEQAIERLSSGSRINGAKDDAAGQAISNRMSSQYSGSAQAQRNTHDGISLLQTAQGALDEINNRLQRVRELSVQGLNSIYSQDNSDAIQAEINLNLKEIDRLAAVTHFNGVNLLDGSAGDIHVQVGANTGDQVALNFSPPGIDVDNLGLTDLVIAGISGNISQVNTLSGRANNIVLNSSNTSQVFIPASLTQQSQKLVRSSADNQYYIQTKDSAGNPAYYRSTSEASYDTAQGRGSVVNRASTITELYPAQTLGNADVTFSDHNNNAITANNARLLSSPAGSILEVSDGAGNFAYYNATVTSTTDQTGNHISVVASSDSPVNTFTDVTQVSGRSTITLDPKNVEINYTDRAGNRHPNVLTTDSKGQYVMNVANNGVSDSKTATVVQQGDGSLAVKTLNGSADVQIYYRMGFSAVTDAKTNKTVISISEFGDEIHLRHPDNPLATLDNAISLVDSKRSYIGVMTNRLESITHVQSESQVSLAAARSRIMDADYATEVSAMSKTTIIQQAATAMLAQANQQAQVVLTLLQRS